MTPSWPTAGGRCSAWYGPGRLPTYCLPPDDVVTDRFTPSAGAGSEDFLVDHDIDVDGRVLTRAARLFRPASSIRGLDGHWTFTWDQVWAGSRRR